MPITVAVEDETIDAYLGVLNDTDVFHKLVVASEDAESRQEPTVAQIALYDVVKARTFREESRLVENLIDSLDVCWAASFSRVIAVCGGVVQAVKTVATSSDLQVSFDIEMRICIPLILIATFADDALDIPDAPSFGLLVRSECLVGSVTSLL